VALETRVRARGMALAERTRMANPVVIRGSGNGLDALQLLQVSVRRFAVLDLQWEDHPVATLVLDGGDVRRACAAASLTRRLRLGDGVEASGGTPLPGWLPAANGEFALGLIAGLANEKVTFDILWTDSESDLHDDLVDFDPGGLTLIDFLLRVAQFVDERVDVLLTRKVDPGASRPQLQVIG
jgi:hypothetical protein